MQKDIVMILMEKENRCRNYQKQARQALERHDMIPNEEQCSYLQQAADLEFEMSTQTSGAERDHHIREKNRLDYEIMKIREELELRSRPAKTAKAAANSGAKKSIKNDGSEEDGDNKKTPEEQELDRVARTWYKDAPSHSFNEVSGMSELKKKLAGCIADKKAQELMDYLKIPRLNSYFFVGPPGCGKTYIIEAFAHELMDKDFKYISIQGSDIISRYVGAAEKNVTRLFEEAEKNAPCIVFIDEVDSLCKNRSLPNLPEYAANITTQFLTGYNRIHSADSEVIFIAATNYPNRVDVAMLDRAEIVRVPLPDTEAREAAFAKYFDGIVQLQNGFTFREMAEKTRHYNYRDIERLASAIKRMLFHEMLDLFKVDVKAIEALSTGKYRLSRSRFQSIIEKFKPSPKETILNDLKKWEREIMSIADYDELDLDRLYESDERGEPVCIESNKVPEMPSVRKPVNTSGEPVYTAKTAFAVDASTHMAEIAFYTDEEQDSVTANINGENYKTNFDDGAFTFKYTPEPGEEEVEVFVSSGTGYLGNFTARFSAPAADEQSSCG